MVTYPSDWKTNKIIEVADIFDNLRIPVTKNQRKPGNTPYYGANGIQDYVSGYTHDGEFVLIAEDGANDLQNYPVTYASGKIWVNNHAHVLAGVNSKADTRFLAYLLKKVDFAAVLVGGTRAKLNGKTLKNIEVTLPERLKEQQAIASALSDFDEHIDNLSELIEKKKAIRDGALEDLVSGRTRLDGFDGEWEEGTIGDILTIHHGKNQHSVESFDGKYPILGTGGIIGKATEFLCDWECVLIGRKGTIDNPMYMNTPFWTIDTLYYSKPKINQCVKFQYYLFCTINWLDYAESSGRPSLAKNVIEGVPISIPNIPEQQAIAQVLSAMDEEIESLKIEKDKMIQIKEGAMDDLLTGRVRLKV
ncbi:MAG: restriction endonuclease subunit S [Anaerovoracaceae bacterium]